MGNADLIFRIVAPGRLTTEGVRLYFSSLCHSPIKKKKPTLLCFSIVYLLSKEEGFDYSNSFVGETRDLRTGGIWVNLSAFYLICCRAHILPADARVHSFYWKHKTPSLAYYRRWHSCIWSYRPCLKRFPIPFTVHDFWPWPSIENRTL